MWASHLVTWQRTLSQCLEKESYISSEQESINDLLLRRTAVPGDTLPIKELWSGAQPRLSRRSLRASENTLDPEGLATPSLLCLGLPTIILSAFLRAHETEITFFSLLEEEEKKTRQLKFTT